MPRLVACVGNCRFYSTRLSVLDSPVAHGIHSMREFTTPSFPVYMYDADGAYTVKTMGEVSHPLQLAVIDYSLFLQLLPDSFGPNDLPR